METTAIFSVPFDIDDYGNLCEGELICKESSIEKYINHTFVASYTLNDIDSIEESIDMGCGGLELCPCGASSDSNIALCRFSMALIDEISDFCKACNHLIKTGEAAHSGSISHHYCPKCGRKYIDGMDECLFCVKKGAVFTRAFRMFGEYRQKLITISLYLLLSTMATVAVPLIQGNLIDNYLAPTAASNPYFHSPAQGVTALVIIMIALNGLGILFNILGTILAGKTGSAFSSNLRKVLFDKVQSMSVGAVQRHTCGDLIKRVTDDTQQVRDFFVSTGSKLLEKSVTFLVVLIILCCINWKLALLVLLPVPLILFIYYKQRLKISSIFGKQWRMASREKSILHDIIKGIRVVKSFGNEKRAIDKFAAASKSFADISIRNERYWALFMEPITFFMGIGEFLVLIVGGKMVLDHNLTLGQFVQFNLFLVYLYQPLRWMSSLPRSIANTTTGLIKIYEILDEKIEIDDLNATKAVHANGSVAFEDVTFGYKSFKPVLKHMSFTIAPGEMIGLVGHSGAGKSTVINLIMRLFDPNSGKILLDGMDIRELEQHDFRDKIGAVFQETFLFSGSIYENIVYARPGAQLDEVIAAAKTANAHDFIMNLPDGYNTIIGENGHTLSGGERQRLAIARAVLKDPPILILDEATSALDPETEASIQEALTRLTQNRTTVAIAHRLSTLRNANRLIVIEKGEIAEMGSHKELLTQKGIYYNLVMAQRQLTQKT